MAETACVAAEHELPRRKGCAIEIFTPEVNAFAIRSGLQGVPPTAAGGSG
jgi:hypothetical protein